MVMLEGSERSQDSPGIGRWVFALAGVAVLVYLFTDPPIRHPPGVLVPEEPRQTRTTGRSWEAKGYRITPLAEYLLRGVVWRTERYWFDRGADLSPIDFVVGWGPMSDQSVADRLSITQGTRFAEWSPRGRQFPIPMDDINSHAANVHLIPAGPEIRRRLLSVRRASVVVLEGQLVLVEGKDGFRWQSSVSRTDTGAGACELLWVSRVEVEQ